MANNNGVGGEYQGIFQKSHTFSSAYHALHFANGTTKVLNTFVEGDKFPWRSGKEFYEQLCLPQNATGSSGSDSSSSEPTPAPVGYPKPAYREDDNMIMAFFPETKELEDIAVLAITSFNVLTPHSIDQFTEVGRNLILDAAHKGRRRSLSIFRLMVVVLSPQLKIYIASSSLKLPSIMRNDSVPLKPSTSLVKPSNASPLRIMSPSLVFGVGSRP